MPAGDALHRARRHQGLDLVGDLPGSAPPSTSSSRNSLPSTPPARLTSSAASRAQVSQVGPKIPAGPRIGYTRATFRTDPSAVNHSGARRRGGGLCMAHMMAAEVVLPNRRFAG
ncbi:hypothetical protein LRR80_01066 [Streptomyces sp. RO-S4]|nr:hypothetical protein [Streptomyces sp. RO-S4]